MEIRSSTTVVPTGTTGVRAKRQAAADGDADDGAVSFSNSQALHDALGAEPEVRSGAVDRLRATLAESGRDYPPAAVLKKVSNLIADRVASAPEDQA